MSDRTAEELKKIVELSDRVGRVAQGLLSHSRPSSSQHSCVDITTCARRALSMVEQRAAKLDVRVHDFMPQRLPPVRADSQELEQVFLNLLINALDAMPQGGTLTLTASEIPDHALHGRVCASVEDTGRGITPDVREHVFEPFFTTKPPGKGTGLGLSICRGLVRSYGGEIEIDSQEDIGTCVTVCVPVHAEEAHHD